MKCKVVILTLSSLFISASGQGSKLGSPNLMTRPRSNIMVSLTESLDGIYGEINSRTYSTRTAKLQAMTNSLRTATRRWHRPILEGLEEYGVETKSFWITNQIYVKDATPATIAYLTGLPSVRSVDAEVVITLQEPTSPSLTQRPSQTEWGVERIGAPEVWGTTQGNGSRIAVIDTGVRFTHESLINNFVGLRNNGWFDPIRFSIWPTDRAGHGTHCTSTACGQTGTGVAPGAQWMACRGCDILDSSGLARCPQNSLLWCGEWSVCPFNVFGGNANCSAAPHVVSNSWTLGQNTTFFNGVIRAWNEANIIGVFALGNAGPQCNTHGSPADQDGVISVGSINITDNVSTFSSRGSNSGNTRPLPSIVAPGEGINAAYIFGDDNYEVLSGTSMACPHVAGAVALMKAMRPNMTFSEVTGYLFSSADTNIGNNTDITQCEVDNAERWPNNVAGFGIADIAAAFRSMLNQTQSF